MQQAKDQLRRLMSSSSFMDINLINNLTAHGHVHGPSCSHSCEENDDSAQVVLDDADGSIGE